MLKIRLQRWGRNKQPHYAIVVADSRSRREGRKVDALGYFNPFARDHEQSIVLDIKKVDEWVAKGAQMTPRVKSLYLESKRTPQSAESMAS